ncbi:MAG: FAD-dependent oxidoreductase, partial [Bacteroidota bacterium]
GSQSQLHPHQNNGHPLLQDSYFDEKLFFAGTESSTRFSGYMEGAILSAASTANKLLT